MPNLLADNAARRDLSLYKSALQRFRDPLEGMLGQIPKSLAFAHLIYINPNLEMVPKDSWNGRKGLMHATHEAATQSGIDWKRIDDVNVNAYVWCWDLNYNGPLFQQANTNYFEAATEDFWKCLYARHIMGTQTFNFFWDRRPHTTGNSEYENLTASVTSWGKPSGGWPYQKLHNTLFIGLSYVFSVAKLNGRLSSNGFGLRPILTESKRSQIFMS